MANYNKIILIGNLTRDPQMSYLPSQTAVVEFGLAVNRRWRGQDNQQKEETCFIDCRCYGKQAETLKQYTAKGRQLLVEGRLQFDMWEGKDGVKRSKHRVFVERFQFLDSGGQRGPAAAAAPQQQRQGAPASADVSDEMPPEPPPTDFEDPGNQENIPF